MKSFSCLIIFFITYFVSLRSQAQILGLFEGETCRKGVNNSSNYVCRPVKNCVISRNDIKKNNYPQLCSFKGSTPIVCCPPMSQVTTTTVKPPVVFNTYSASEMCYEYSKLIYFKIKDPVLSPGSTNKYISVKRCYDVERLIVNGTKAAPMEFPHMALLGYSEKVEENNWSCGGSLISKNWILTAAHCEKIDNWGGTADYARWARLGDLNYLVDTDNTYAKNYKIVQHIIHPKYTRPALYNDIGLFRLEKDVEFSPFVRPICLNTDNSLKPPIQIATGWGQIESGGPSSPDLLKVALDTIPVNQCNQSYSVGQSLPFGIVEDSMVCAGYLKGGKDTCLGDSGGPTQIKNSQYTCMYTQIGITSFGSTFCAEKNKPGVYTKVSNYISWIEQIVWPRL